MLKPMILHYGEKVIRVCIDQVGNPWWALNDICGVVGEHSHNVLNFLQDNDYCTFNCIDPALISNKKTHFINLAGLFAAIYSLNKNQSFRLKEWILQSALPEIRKTDCMQYIFNNLAEHLIKIMEHQVNPQIQKESDVPLLHEKGEEKPIGTTKITGQVSQRRTRGRSPSIKKVRADKIDIAYAAIDEATAEYGQECAEATIWGRFNENRNKLVMLWACSENPLAPRITKEGAQWAVDVTEYSCRLLCEAVRGHVAENMFHKQMLKVLEAVKRKGKESPGGWVYLREIYKTMHKSQKEIMEVMTALEAQEQIEIENDSRGPRSTMKVRERFG